MLKTEIVEICRKNCVHTWSDKNMMIKQLETGNLYDEAYDLVSRPMTYEETDIPNEENEEDEEEEN